MNINEIEVGDTVKVNNLCVDGKRGIPIEREYTVLEKGNDGYLLLSVPSHEGGYIHDDTVFKNQTTYWYFVRQVIEVTKKVEATKKNPIESESPVKIGDMIRLTNRKALLSSVPEKEKERLMIADHEVIAIANMTGSPVIRMPSEYGGHKVCSDEPGRIIDKDSFEKIQAPLKKEIKAGDLVKFTDPAIGRMFGKSFRVLKVGYNNNPDVILLSVPEELGGYDHGDSEFRCPSWSTFKRDVEFAGSESTPSKSDTTMTSIKVGDWISPTEETKKEIQDGYKMRFCPPSLKKELSELKFEVTDVNGSSLKLAKIPSKYCLTDWEVNAKDYILATQVQKEDPVKKEPKYQVHDRVFLPKRFKDELPEECFNCIPEKEYFEFCIVYKKANSTDVDYFLNIAESDGGKFEKNIYRTGRWINEKFLLSYEEMEAEKKKNQPTTINELIQEKLSEKEIVKMTTALKPAENTSTSIAQYEEIMKETRVFSVLLPPMVEFGKTAIRWAVHTACKALGKSAEFFTGAMMLVEDFLKNNAAIANNAMQWILGFLAKNVHHLRKIPGIKDLKMLAFLEREDIQRFGMHAQASSEGNVLGDFATKVWGFVQEWVFGSAIATRISEAASSPEGLMRFLGEMDSGMKARIAEGINESVLRENEAHRETAAINEMKPAMASAVA